MPMAKDFRLPEDTDTQLHVFMSAGGTSLDELLGCIRNHFGDDVSGDQLEITAENIQVQCFGYDLYDSADYMDFLVVRKV